jgi:hypothetical protein
LLLKKLQEREVSLYTEKQKQLCARQMMMKLEIILNFSRTENAKIKKKSKIRSLKKKTMRERKKNLTHIQAIAVSDFHFLFDLLVKYNFHFHCCFFQSFCFVSSSLSIYLHVKFISYDFCSVEEF